MSRKQLVESLKLIRRVANSDYSPSKLARILQYIFILVPEDREAMDLATDLKPAAPQQMATVRTMAERLHNVLVKGSPKLLPLQVAYTPAQRVHVTKFGTQRVFLKHLQNAKRICQLSNCAPPRLICIQDLP